MLLNELKRSYQEDAQRVLEDEDDVKRAEMEKRLRALNIDFTPEKEQELDELKTVSKLIYPLFMVFCLQILQHKYCK